MTERNNPEGLAARPWRDGPLRGVTSSERAHLLSNAAGGADRRSLQQSCAIRDRLQPPSNVSSDNSPLLWLSKAERLAVCCILAAPRHRWSGRRRAVRPALWSRHIYPL